MATTSPESLVKLGILGYYDGKSKAWTEGKISDEVGKLGKVFSLLETVYTRVEDLPTEGVVKGSIAVVKPAGRIDSDEYFWTGSNWELLGTSAFDLSGYITETALYKGESGTGTIANPADGTILAVINAAIEAVDAGWKAELWGTGEDDSKTTPADGSVIKRLNTVEGTASAAATAAATAQTAAETADGKAVTAQTAAETADGKAQTAQTTADNTNNLLYAGTDGTGTAAEPADGSVIKRVADLESKTATFATEADIDALFADAQA